MKNAAIRLSLRFFDEVKQLDKDDTGKIKAPNSYKTSIMENIEQLLAGGLDEGTLGSYFEAYVKEHPSPKEAYNVDDVLKFLGVESKRKEIKRDPNNLMHPNAFYYHPVLQLTPPPPVVRQLDDGSFVSSYEEEDFFLEMKDSFTYEDLVDYFHKVMNISGEGYRQRDVGAFKHLLKSHSLDEVLYTIDASRFYAEDYSKPLPKNPFDIRDYTDEGASVLDERKNTCYMEGLDRVIPRNVN